VSSVDAQDKELLDLLRAEIDGQAPPPVHTALDDVVRRGRRRLRVRRLGAALGVIAVVGGVGVATTLLRGLPGTTFPADQLNAASSVSGAPTPTSAGWVLASPGAKDCDNGVRVPGTPPAGSVNPPLFEDQLLKALTSAAPKATVNITEFTMMKPGTSDGMLATTWADVIDSGGGGSVYVEVHSYSGDPVQAADGEKFVSGDCTVPYRMTLPTGAVMQLYPVHNYDPGHPSQALRVYTPSHRLYVITAEGFSSADWRQVPGEDAKTVPTGAGRHSLPLTQDQLTAVGKRLAELG
jgi:hypothetical protein